MWPATKGEQQGTKPGSWCDCRNRLLEALSPLGTPGDGIGGGEGAIYLWARLPEGTVIALLSSLDHNTFCSPDVTCFLLGTSSLPF